MDHFHRLLIKTQTCGQAWSSALVRTVYHSTKTIFRSICIGRTVLSKPFATCHLKLYHYRDKIDPIVRFEWKANTDVEITNSDDEELEITEKGNFGADNILVINRARNDRQPGIPRPWELRGKDADEYWQCVYQDVMSGKMKKRADNGRLAPWEEELLRWTENDTQFWNYKDDFKDMKLDEIPRFKTPLLRPQLFIWKEGNEWLPIGKLKFACTETSLSRQYHMELTLELSEPSIELFSRNMTYFTSDFEWKSWINNGYYI